MGSAGMHSYARAASGALVSALLAACAPSATVTVTRLPAAGRPGVVGFGVVQQVQQSALLTQVSTTVGLAAGAERDAPLGDYVWRIRERMLEYCAWQSGEATDCRFAVFEDGLAMNPTLVEPVNLGRFRAVLTSGNQRSSFVANAVSGAPGALPATRSHGVWVRSIPPLPFLPAPLHYCGLEAGAPTCRALSVGGGRNVGRVLSVGVHVQGGVETEYVWVSAGTPGALIPFVGISFNETAIVRCALTDGKTPPACVEAKWE